MEDNINKNPPISEIGGNNNNKNEMFIEGKEKKINLQSPTIHHTPSTESYL